MADHGQHPLSVQDRPVQGRPVQERPVQERPVQDRPEDRPATPVTPAGADPDPPRDAVLVRAAHIIVDLPPLRPTIVGAARLIAETVLVPTALLAILLHVSGLVVAFAAALGWCYLTVAVRWFAGRRMPATLVLCASMLTGRACLALWLSSAVVYLLQPIVGSVFMAMLFLGSALLGRPLTMRLCRDFVKLPAHVLDRHRVRKMFRDVALLWGLSRIVDAAMSLGLLRGGVDAGLLARGVISPVLTVLTVLVCAYWGKRCLHLDGIRLRRHRLAPTG